MPESAKRSLVIFIYTVLILSTLTVFWQVRNFDFVNYDDNVYVYENEHVLGGLSWDSIVWAFTSSYASFWHPVTWLSLMVDRQLFGLDPGWMHLTNVLLHLANSLLLFTVLRKMTGSLWPSAFVAAAFALHPMHIESVAWISERKDVLSTFFLMLTLAAYAGYVKRPSGFRYVAVLALFAVGLMAKPMLITLPFILLLLDYWPLNRFEAKISSGQPRKHAAVGGSYAPLRRIIVEKIPFLVLAIVFSVVTFITQQKGGGLVDTTTIPLKDRLGNAFLSYGAYIGKMFWPKDLAAHYPFSARTVQFWQVLLCLLLMAGVSFLVLRLGRTRKYLPVGWFWFVGTLVPVIGLVRFTGSSYADRFTYVPYTGLFIMIAWGLPELLSKWPQRKTVLGLSMAAALTILGICAHQQVAYWRDSITLFSHAIEVTKDNDMAYKSRGTVYHELGRHQEAMDDLNQAIRIRPDYIEAYNNRGLTYGALGRWQEAIEDFNRAIRLNPDYPDAYRNLGVTYGKLGRWQEAIEGFSQAIRIRPDDAKARYGLADVLSRQDRFEEAIDQYRAAIRLKSDWPDPMNDLAWLIATGADIKGRDTDEAIRLASRACELANNEDPVLLDTLAAAYASAGRFSEAIETANKALDLADAANQPQLRNDIQYHLSFYTQGKPYVESASRPLSDPDKL